MNQSKRVCKMKGHDEYPIYHICTQLECDQPTRWSCVDCISEGIHNHDKPNNFHIMKIKDFLIRLRGESEKVKELFLSNITRLEKANKELEGLQNTLISYKQYIENQIAQTSRRIKLFQNSLAQDNFEMLDDNNLNDILQINLQQNNQLLLKINDIKQQLNQIEIIIKEEQGDQNQSFNIVNDNKRNYKIQKIDDAKLPLFGSSLSKNEQYFAYGGEEKLLNVYDMSINQKVKEIKLYCQFTEDSSQLFVGLMDGFVQGFDAQNYFRQLFKKQIHSSLIFKIITIQSEFIITCSQDKSIIKTDVVYTSQIFKLTGHTDNIIGIDYNANIDMIVSGSLDLSINIWNCKNNGLQINKKQAHMNSNGIVSVQFINDCENIFSLDAIGTYINGKLIQQTRILLRSKHLVIQITYSNFNTFLKMTLYQLYAINI